MIAKSHLKPEKSAPNEQIVHPGASKAAQRRSSDAWNGLRPRRTSIPRGFILKEKKI